MIVGRFLAKPICHFLGYLYPAWQSYKAVRLNEPSLHTQWLTFWIVSTYFSFLEMFGDTLLSWMPFYYEAKVALLVWLVTPYFKGATTIYEKFINPYLHKYEKDIDERVEEVKRRSAKHLVQFGQTGMRHIRSQSGELIRMGQQVLISQLKGEDGSSSTTTTISETATFTQEMKMQSVQEEEEE